ncbi:glycosyltransferase family 4 protein [Leptolyngbya sp. NIES-2104]|uniref:glycosyltransferase family 4 protein n=1 Tax=Leptolyngbya sp. NIES-2104 TaxID=1552121 RepID=UPI0006EC6D96|nr:glycosyltransferase family 4 protein [Leptolyngbya sp. NIES-2104]GAP97589.1 glycosyltransferase [Leptolyngbya sp. NIES-2104]
MLKVAVLFVNFGPYHLARLAAFQEECDRQNWHFVGIELTRTDHVYAWRTELDAFPGELHTVFSDRTLAEIPAWTASQRLIALLNQLQPDVIAIMGYAEPTMLAALAWSRWHRKATILMSATKEDDAPRSRFGEGIKRQIIRQYQSALVGGKPQQRYLEKLGLASEQIFTGYNTVGNADFHPDRIRQLPRPNEKPYFLAINRFVSKKNLPVLIDAYAAYRNQVGEAAWELVLCGDGELRSELEQQIATLNLTESIRLPGFLQQAELLPYLAYAECFVHTSLQEQWGLVVNEAMAAGLPVIVSNRCGCFEDLVIEGVNGFGFDPNNTGELAALMVTVSDRAIDLDKMGQAAIAQIQQFAPDRFAQGLSNAVNRALQLV